MTMIEVPDYWVLFNPEGRAKGSVYGAFTPAGGGDPVVYNATEEQAWVHFSPAKRKRDQMVRQGWKVRPVNGEDRWAEFWWGDLLWEEPATETATPG